MLYWNRTKRVMCNTWWFRCASPSCQAVCFSWSVTPLLWHPIHLSKHFLLVRGPRWHSRAGNTAAYQLIFSTSPFWISISLPGQLADVNTLAFIITRLNLCDSSPHLWYDYYGNRTVIQAYFSNAKCLQMNKVWMAKRWQRGQMTSLFPYCLHAKIE